MSSPSERPMAAGDASSVSPDVSRKRGRDGRRMNPASLANLQRGGGRPVSLEHRPNLHHGGYAVVAADVLDAKEAEVFAALAADAPLRDSNGELPRADTVVVRLLAEALCRLDSVKADIRDHGWKHAKSGNPRPVVELERRLRAEVFDYLRDLGMTPAGRARLGLDLVRSRDLALEMAADAELERREQEAS